MNPRLGIGSFVSIQLVSIPGCGLGLRHDDAAEHRSRCFRDARSKIAPEFRHQGTQSFADGFGLPSPHNVESGARRREVGRNPRRFTRWIRSSEKTTNRFGKMNSRRHCDWSNRVGDQKPDYPPEVWRAFWSTWLKESPRRGSRPNLGINLWAGYTASLNHHPLPEELADFVAD